ncbi:FadR/GntR family transcriptional regulator [Nesterenkonia sp. Act20]|uniref:FadR/GntR family transcriptional regulator n=1 Tax=Nesterenkonia sp. Act20 TaxID=1483432 RepID=UPI002100203D|nr:FCD domain-containing protein [Nesterenkonia sp. Act20]
MNKVMASAPVGYSSIVNALGLSITSGDIAPGDVMTLNYVQEEFGVSRTIARDVMRVLESLGLLYSRRRVGLIVQDFSEWKVLDPRVIRWRLEGQNRSAQLRSLTELRVAVEPFAAGAAAESATEEDIEELLRIAGELRRTGENGDVQAFLQYDIEFHSRVLRSTGNELFSALTEAVTEVLAGRTHAGLMPTHPSPASLDAHERVAWAIRDGDPHEAERAMQGTLTAVREELRLKVHRSYQERHAGGVEVDRDRDFEPGVHATPSEPAASAARDHDSQT